MITDYKQIDGWFDYEKVFDDIIGNLIKKKIRPKVVEIGAWLGKSSFYLTEKWGKKCDIFIVDTWNGSANELESSHRLATEKDIFVDFMYNMKHNWGKFIPIRTSSENASTLFEDNELDFVFIDAEHTYQGLSNDLRCWMPKIKKTGILAGHDYHENWSGVIKAVDEIIGKDNIKLEGCTWIKN